MSLLERCGPRVTLHFDVVQTDHCSAGYFNVYFPVPLGSPCEKPSVFVANGGKKHIRVSLPSWRICNELRIVYYQWDPLHKCYTRQAQGVMQLDPEHVNLRNPQAFTVVLAHVGHYSRRRDNCCRVTLKLTDLVWKNVTVDQHTQAIGFMNQFGSGVKVSPFVLCSNLTRLYEYLQRERQRSHEIVHKATGLPPWYIEGRPSIVGDLPLWAFALGYAHPNDTGAGVVAALRRMCRMALAMLGKTENQLTHVDTVELMADVASLLPRCLKYTADTFLPYQPDKSTPYSPDTQSHRLLYEDIWCLLTSAPEWTKMGYDCEDGALLAYHVVRLLQTTPTDHGDTLLRSVQMKAHLYEPFVAVGTLNCLSMASTTDRVVTIYHCYLMMVCKAAVGAKLRGRRLRAGHKHEETLIVETTEWTTAHPSYYNSTAAEYRCCAMVDSRVHMKVPRSVMEASGQYDVVLQLLCPHLFKDPYYKIPSIHCETADGEYGVTADQLVHNFASGDWVASQWADVDQDLFDLVSLFASALPPCQSIGDLAHGYIGDTPQPGPDGLVLYVRTEDAGDVMPLIDRYLGARGVSYTVQKDVTFLRGLSLTLVQITRSDASAHPGTRPETPLEDVMPSEEELQDPYVYRRYDDLNRVLAQAHYPVRGRKVYHNTMVRHNRQHPEFLRHRMAMAVATQ